MIIPLSFGNMFRQLVVLGVQGGQVSIERLHSPAVESFGNMEAHESTLAFLVNLSLGEQF